MEQRHYARLRGDSREECALVGAHVAAWLSQFTLRQFAVRHSKKSTAWFGLETAQSLAHLCRENVLDLPARAWESSSAW